MTSLSTTSMGVIHETPFPARGALPKIFTSTETINDDEVANAGWYAIRAGAIHRE